MSTFQYVGPIVNLVNYLECIQIGSKYLSYPGLKYKLTNKISIQNSDSTVSICGLKDSITP